MKLFCFFLISTGLQATAGLAQISFDTTGGRFRQPIFDSVVVTSNIPYAIGINVQGQAQTLVMDVYQPFQDNASERPLLVMVHGGSFMQGNKLDLAQTCTHFAQKGYVTASIQYRLGYTSFTPVAAVATVIRATQDLKNAIRFLRKQADFYRINPDFVFAGGVSAGSITALHAAYMDQLSEIPAGQSIPTLDSLHNTGQIPGFDWRFKTVINIAGGVGDTSWMKENDIPVTSFHGTADAVVPYESGNFGLFSLYGSHPIFLRAQNLQINSELRPFPGAGHDYSLDNPGATDTTLARITRFLFPLLFQEVTQRRILESDHSHFTLANDGWGITTNGNECLEVFDLSGRLEQTIEILSPYFVLPHASHSRMVRMVKSGKRQFIPALGK